MITAKLNLGSASLHCWNSNNHSYACWNYCCIIKYLSHSSLKIKSRQLVCMRLLVLPSCSPGLISRPLCLFFGRCLWAATSVGSPSPTAAPQYLTKAAASANMVSAAHPPSQKSQVALAAGNRCHAVPSASWTWAHLFPIAKVNWTMWTDAQLIFPVTGTHLGAA